METGSRRAGPRRRARVVLRASGKRHQIEVSEGSETCDSASEPEGHAGELAATTHYDHCVLDWTSHTPHRTRVRGRVGVERGGEGLVYEPLDETISSNVFQEKLEFSGHVLHSTPSHPQPRTLPSSLLPVQYPMTPGCVSSTVFHEHEHHPSDSQDSSSSDLDCEDDVFLQRPRTAPTLRHTPRVKVKVHPEPPSPLVNNVSTLSSSFPKPSSPTLHHPYTSPQSSSTETSPLHPKHPHRLHRGGGRWAFRHVYPQGTKSPSSRRSTNLHSTSSSNTSSRQDTVRLLSSDSMTSTGSSWVTPLLTSLLRKGGRRPSVDTRWDLSGEDQLESCFPDKHIRVFVATWNMHEEKVSEQGTACLQVPLLTSNRSGAARVPRRYPSSPLPRAGC